mmetsp:Transcript_37039/g.72850  ORF Transcript_37039/g.72850 Transcript_37039/m.72850 type:complete len:124 (-) Transcript_37039:491-862(-)
MQSMNHEEVQSQAVISDLDFFLAGTCSCLTIPIRWLLGTGAAVFVLHLQRSLGGGSMREGRDAHCPHSFTSEGREGGGPIRAEGQASPFLFSKRQNDQRILPLSMSFCTRVFRSPSSHLMQRQ